MIIGRIANALKRQDWSTFLVEILIVVIGILIGLQVDDWVTARQDRQDERQFLERLHADILQADEQNARLRDRRLGSAGAIMTAIEVLYGESGRDELTNTECIALANSNVFNINVPSLPAFDELIGVGRLDILSDRQLRSALVQLEQARTALSTLLVIQSSQAAFAFLPGEFPELLRMGNYVDESGEVRIQVTCDLEGIRNNQEFLNKWALNADGYDAYVRDGLAPWVAQFERVHRLVDATLGISHDKS
ncbi:MAG: hypothetical protein P8X81_01140 [Woeseiaceae bacterium]|jgi:hypothetical protein